MVVTYHQHVKIRVVSVSLAIQREITVLEKPLDYSGHIHTNAIPREEKTPNPLTNKETTPLRAL